MTSERYRCWVCKRENAPQLVCPDCRPAWEAELRRNAEQAPPSEPGEPPTLF